MRIPIINSEKNEDMNNEESNESEDSKLSEGTVTDPVEAELADTKAQLVQLAADFRREAVARTSLVPPMDIAARITSLLVTGPSNSAM